MKANPIATPVRKEQEVSIIPGEISYVIWDAKNVPIFCNLSEEQATLLCSALNNFDALVEALKKANEYLQGLCPQYLTDDGCDLTDELRAVIDRIEKGD
jgi:hypothetical protein